MIHKVNVLSSARKHGFEVRDIVHAWCNYLKDSKDHDRAQQSVHVRVGTTSSGVLVEMLAAWSELDEEWQVFHAMRPSTGLMGYLGLEGGARHGRKRSH